jgi:hypothetical protein
MAVKRRKKLRRTRKKGSSTKKKVVCCCGGRSSRKGKSKRSSGRGTISASTGSGISSLMLPRAPEPSLNNEVFSRAMGGLAQEIGRLAGALDRAQVREAVREPGGVVQQVGLARQEPEAPEVMPGPGSVRIKRERETPLRRSPVKIKREDSPAVKRAKEALRNYHPVTPPLPPMPPLIDEEEERRSEERRAPLKERLHLSRQSEESVAYEPRQQLFDSTQPLLSPETPGTRMTGAELQQSQRQAESGFRHMYDNDARYDDLMWSLGEGGGGTATESEFNEIFGDERRREVQDRRRSRMFDRREFGLESDSARARRELAEEDREMSGIFDVNDSGYESEPGRARRELAEEDADTDAQIEALRNFSMDFSFV